MLAHAIRQICGYADIELSRLVNDVNVPIAHGLLGWDGLPSPSLCQAQDKLTSGLVGNRDQIKKGA